ncbi:MULTISPECIES: hypothetical protein [unclassified Halorubrum]|uniref:hypothetical protein n=1 Tax=unclassified Halorubrum TaxID=2642239 RepID=UPI00114004B0|nr:MULTISPECIES: hypothetical protein [unclassified Halorubrum]
MKTFTARFGVVDMERRQYLQAIGGCFGVVSISGCTEILPGSNQESEYPGGTFLVENTGNNAVPVSVETKLDQYDASLDIEVAAGTTVARPEFVTANQGEIVTLVAQFGSTGDAIRFQFLPAGGEDTPPEVAQLTVENAVEASATWTATSGR